MMETNSYTVVARLRDRELGDLEYMGISPQGAPSWFSSPSEATVYQSRRAAIMAAAQLASSNRAFPLSAPQVREPQDIRRSADAS
jgi:hypothetical protein